MLRRAVLAVLVGLFVTTACAGPASACNDPTLQAVDPGAAARGDTVSFTIINTEPGASWQISINGGSPLRSGTASGGYVTGSFPMPDMGSSDTTVSVEARVTHSDIPGGSLPSARPLDYRAPAAASAPAPSAAGGDTPPAALQPGAQSAPSAQSSPPASTAPHSPGAAPPSPGSGKPAGPKPRRTAAPPVHRPATARTPQTVRGSTAAVAPVRSVIAAQPEVSATPVVHASAGRDPTARRRPSDIRVPTPVARSTEAPMPAAVASGARSSDRGALDDTAAVLIAVTLITLLGGIGRMGIRSRRRRPLPAIPGAAGTAVAHRPADALEAELQELLSEEAARREVVKS